MYSTNICVPDNLDGAMNRGQKQTDLIIMDFAKAFDKVPYRRLLHKLDYYGIRGSTHKWISSWLSGRSQQVVLDGQASDPVPVLCGELRVLIRLRTDPFSNFH